jgi:hypothetical protein
MGFALMGTFMVATAKPVLETLFEEPREVTLLPSTEKSEPMDLAAKILASLKGKGPEYRAYVRHPRDKSAFVTVGSIIGGHYSWNPQGFTVWVDAWEKDPRYPPDSILAIRELRSGRSFPATEEGVRMALGYVQREFPTFTESRWVSRSIPIYVAGELGILKPEFLPQVEHGSPQLTEEQLRKMRQLLGLTADVAEILRTHRRTGYIP